MIKEGKKGDPAPCHLCFLPSLSSHVWKRLPVNWVCVNTYTLTDINRSGKKKGGRWWYGSKVMTCHTKVKLTLMLIRKLDQCWRNVSSSIETHNFCFHTSIRCLDELLNPPDLVWGRWWYFKEYIIRYLVHVPIHVGGGGHHLGSPGHVGNGEPKGDGDVRMYSKGKGITQSWKPDGKARRGRERERERKRDKNWIQEWRHLQPLVPHLLPFFTLTILSYSDTLMTHIMYYMIHSYRQLNTTWFPLQKLY